MPQIGIANSSNSSAPEPPSGATCNKRSMKSIYPPLAWILRLSHTPVKSWEHLGGIDARDPVLHPAFTAAVLIDSDRDEA